jgi:predicted DNA-binding protein
MTESTKQELIKFIKSLPDDISIEDFKYHLYVKETIEKRVKDIEDGNVKLISHKEAKEQIKKWLK